MDAEKVQELRAAALRDAALQARTRAATRRDLMRKRRGRWSAPIYFTKNRVSVREMAEEEASCQMLEAIATDLELAAEKGMDPEQVKVSALVWRCGQNRRLVGVSVREGPPHVLYQIENDPEDTMAVVRELMEYGYRVEITTKFKDVSVLEWASIGGSDVAEA